MSALTPVLERSPGAWVGWTGSAGPAPHPFAMDDLLNVPVPISEEELQHYYSGFCNRTIWPLYHDAVRQPEYHRRWWARYLAVNERFAQAAAEVAELRGRIWVHDYQLQLVPGMIRELRPDLRIGFFLHIPFPPEELFARLPWRRRILEGILGADIIGFQTQLGAENFIRLIRRFTDADVSARRVQFRDRSIKVGAFPVSIDFQRYEQAARAESVTERSEQLRQQLGLGRKLIAGIDRLDYTKGIDVRLKAFHELLSSGRKSIRDCVLVQVAVPSRGLVEEYQDLRREVEELVGQINGEFGEVGVAAVHYLHRNLPFEELLAIYRAAQVMLITPFGDGMNLVAKEYVATRYDDSGVLVLSEFAGAARELKDALLVNPHDVDGLTATIDVALSMQPEEAAERMRAMRAVVRNHTVFDWAESFVAELAA